MRKFRNCTHLPALGAELTVLTQVTQRSRFEGTFNGEHYRYWAVRSSRGLSQCLDSGSLERRSSCTLSRPAGVKLPHWVSFFRDVRRLPRFPQGRDISKGTLRVDRGMTGTVRVRQLPGRDHLDL